MFASAFTWRGSQAGGSAELCGSLRIPAKPDTAQGSGTRQSTRGPGSCVVFFLRNLFMTARPLRSLSLKSTDWMRSLFWTQPDGSTGASSFWPRKLAFHAPQVPVLAQLGDSSFLHLSSLLASLAEPSGAAPSTSLTVLRKGKTRHF